MSLEPIESAKIVAREKYVWPGGYPLVLVMSDGEILCPDCVRSEFRNIVRYTKWKQHDSGWWAVAYAILEDFENSETCAHCGKSIT